MKKNRNLVNLRHDRATLTAYSALAAKSSPRLLANTLAISVAEKTGLGAHRCFRVIETMCDVMMKHIGKGEWLEIEGFGTFMGRGRSKKARGKDRRNPQRERQVRFCPDAAFVDRVNVLTPRLTPYVRQTDRPGFNWRMPWASTVTTQPRNLTAMRQADADLIEVYIAARRRSNAESERILYPTHRGFTDHVADLISRTLRSFSRRCSVPLIEVTKQHVLATADVYFEKLWPRVLKANPLAQKEDVWKTVTWHWVTKAGKDFYDWLETTGQRPLGSNPFTGMRLFSPLQNPNSGRMIVRQWYEELLAYSHPPMTKAVLYLCANALRASEVAWLRIGDVDFATGMLRVTGKGRKLRVIPLLPWVLDALKDYISSCVKDVSPDKPLFQFTSGLGVWEIVDRAARRAFDEPEKVKHIHPHGLRHYFVTVAMQTGMSIPAIMRITGHTSPAMLMRYRNVDDAELHDELRKLTEKGPPHGRLERH